MKQIFPKEIVDTTIDVHQFQHNTNSKIIYSLLLLSLIATLVALPFIKVAVYNNSFGMIIPDKERITIQNSTNGNVLLSNLSNNKKVIKGDTLLIINNSSVQQQLIQNEYQTKELNNFILDLEYLLKNKSTKQLTSAKFIQEQSFYKQRISELQTRFSNIKENYNRNKKLFEKGVIAQVSLNSSKLEYDLALNAMYQLKQQQQNSWQTQLVNYKNKLNKLKSSEKQLQENKELSVIKAPVSGTLLNVKGIEKGSFLTIGTQIAEVSPQSDLIVECYVNPTNIGLLNKRHKVNFQIGAFNYNQWGLATGTIKDIANDVQIINNTPKFRVLCSIDQNYLQLKNGFKGYLKKGMTLNARFEITKRSLFDLLYDKVDNWLNPTIQIAKEK